MFTILETKKYIKDIRKLKLATLQNVRLNIYLQALRNGYRLDPAAKCKKLRNEWSGFYEISLGLDLRLIYRVSGDTLELIRIGTHAQLFRSL